ncbi:MAG: threonylcarbamoyl-AMP synthase [Opitutales bacterium]|nr:threonylcarbamoyl-AMP synthase [Opitutales bacterium]
MSIYCDILEASRFISEGKIGGVPTETVYGLAANALNQDAVRKIFQAKSRPFIDPLIVHVCDMQMAESVAEFSDDARKLAETFWPGPLTMILPRKGCVPDIVTAGMDSVAVRMPSHKMMNELIKISNLPIAAPSANPFGYVSPTKAEHVVEQLGDKIDFVLDGGDCECGVESTIVMLTSSPKKLLRPGPISASAIEKILGDKIDRNPKKNEAHPQAPGMLKSHYSPKAKLTLFANVEEIPSDFNGEVVFIKRPENPDKNHYWLSEDGNVIDVQKNLFALIRSLDKISQNGIYCQKPTSSDDSWLAVLDRLNRASTKL